MAVEVETEAPSRRERLPLMREIPGPMPNPPQPGKIQVSTPAEEPTRTVPTSQPAGSSQGAEIHSELYTEQHALSVERFCLFYGKNKALHEVSMPAEALLRLAFGRLDAAHTPADVEADLADLDRLRAVFPGF